MINIPAISPNPPPMPTTPPGVPPPPQLPQTGSPGGAPPDQSGAPQGAPPPQQGVIPSGGPSQDGSAAPAPDASEPPQPGDPKPRLIPGTDATTGNIPASPQEQSDYRQLMVKVGNMMHSRASRDQVLSSLHDPQSTVAQAVGRTAASLLMTADGQKQASGTGAISKDVLLEAAKYVIPELMNLGIHAGIFPIKPPKDQSAEGPGAGDDPYNSQIRMAMLEAVKAYGQSQLNRPDAAQLTEKAGNDWADGVRSEVANGTASPAYMAMAHGKSQAAAPPPGQGVIPDDQGAPA